MSPDSRAFAVRAADGHESIGAALIFRALCHRSGYGSATAAVLICVLAVAGIVGFAAPLVVSADSQMAVVTSPGLKMQEGPGTNFDVLGTLRKDERYPVVHIDATSGWVKIRLSNGQTGWISGKHVRLEADERQREALEPMFVALAVVFLGGVVIAFGAVRAYRRRSHLGDDGPRQQPPPTDRRIESVETQIRLRAEPASQQGATDATHWQSIGILFDIDQLGKTEAERTWYGHEARLIFAKHFDPKKIGRAFLWHGDTQATLDGHQRQWCIAITAERYVSLAIARGAFSQANDKGLTPLARRFADHPVDVDFKQGEPAVLRREPLTLWAGISEDGTFLIQKSQLGAAPEDIELCRAASWTFRLPDGLDALRREMQAGQGTPSQLRALSDEELCAVLSGVDCDETGVPATLFALEEECRELALEQPSRYALARLHEIVSWSVEKIRSRTDADGILALLREMGRVHFETKEYERSAHIFGRLAECWGTDDDRHFDALAWEARSLSLLGRDDEAERLKSPSAPEAARPSSPQAESGVGTGSDTWSLFRHPEGLFSLRYPPRWRCIDPLSSTACFAASREDRLAVMEVAALKPSEDHPGLRFFTGVLVKVLRDEHHYLRIVRQDEPFREASAECVRTTVQHRDVGWGNVTVDYFVIGDQRLVLSVNFKIPLAEYDDAVKTFETIARTVEVLPA